MAEPQFDIRFVLETVVRSASQHDGEQRSEGDRDALGQTHTLLLPVRDL